ncbi:hypothetical protein CMI37_17955 [Candidatus Pacearchaeota archaeon]|nr:hypothetical protein [Candidatus Pacearchaeota archaeon]|tara:strand:+ start:1372 stop:1581 length:210 start_codon:yes stop_codon:yes gene_type:complete
MAHDCYEQAHLIDWQAINATIRSFRQNIRDGLATSLDFEPGNGRLVLNSDAYGFVGQGVVSRQKETEAP